MSREVKPYHRVCANCNWQKDLDGRYVECRKGPPIACREDSLAWWPLTKPTDWCGYFVPDSDRMDQGRM